MDDHGAAGCRVREAGPGDLAALADLLDDLDRFYGIEGSTPRVRRLAEIEAMVFRPDPAAHVLLAEHGGRALGFAAYSYLWPAVGLTRSLYLKELYVSTGHRGQGIGERLMRRLHEIATATGCSRVEWTTDRWNVAAQRFYARLGVVANENKLFYRQELGS